MGPSGSGKSTVVNLIPRLYDVTGGSVTVAGVDVRDFDLTYLRQQIGVATQEAYLFNGTILENLRYANESATLEEIEEACKVANIHDYIAAQPLGYDTEVGNRGLKLSGGEKQRLSLARVIQKIKLAGAEDRAFAKWAHGYADYARAAYNRPTLLWALPAIVGLVSLLGNIAIYYLAGSTGVSVPNYMAFNVAYGQVTAAIMALAETAGQVAQINPMLETIEPVMQATPEIAEDKPSVEALSGGIEVSGVSFRYDENSPYILQNLSFKVRSGEYVAIVGKSGCGKSTIMRLLLGFETPERGAIFYGLHDASKVDLRSLRQHIGIVMQDGKLFMAT